MATLPSELTLHVLMRTSLEQARGWVLPGVGVLSEVEGGVTLTGFVQHMDWMARCLAGLHWPIGIVEPPELKTAIKRHAAALVAAAEAHGL
ncbi:MAG: hypothetical protein IT306_19520 [Chloroflexi bacterium]|nr:hypothetical protein [Chloroflexota bacterium]